MDIISLLETLVNEILTAEEKFLKDPKDFYTLETSVKSSTESFSAGFLSCVLSEMDARLCKDAWSFTQSLTMLTWYPEEYKGKFIKKI